MGDIEKLVVALTGLCIALTALIPVVIRLWQKIEETNKRVERNDNRLGIIWKGRLRRGAIEATAQGRAIEKAPEIEAPHPQETKDMQLLLKPDIYDAFKPIATLLRDMRKVMTARGATDEQFAEAVEAKYGAWLAKHICQVLGVSEYACLAMAMSVADELPDMESSIDGQMRTVNPPSPQ